MKGTDSETGYSYYDKNSNYKKISSQELKQITLDQFCIDNKLRNITGIKIDVDGNELQVLMNFQFLDIYFY